MFKTNLWKLLMLVAMVFAVTSAFSQDKDYVPDKGKLKKISKSRPTLLYSPETIFTIKGNGFSDWNAGSWKISNSGISSGNYQSKSKSLAISPELSLPAVSSTEVLQLTIVQSFSLESFYDFGEVLISEDNGATWSVLKRNTGVTQNSSGYIHLTDYAGKKIRLGFRISSDESFESTGWEIHSISLEKGSYVATEKAKFNTTSAPAAGSNLRVTATTAVPSINVLAVREDNFPDQIFVDFEYKEDGQFVTGLTKDKINVQEFLGLQTTGVDQLGCLELFESTSIPRPLDLVVLMDNSGSMSDKQAGLVANLSTFAANLAAKRAQTQFALIRFGQAHPTDINIPVEYAEPANTTVTPVEHFTDDVTIFQNILGRNKVDGWIERGFEAAVLAANTLKFRPNSDRVFVLITDENATAENLGTNDAASTAGILKTKDIRVYSMIPDFPEYDPTYKLLTTLREGKYYDIYNLNMSQFLAELSQSLTNKYTLRYCPVNRNADGVERKVEIQLKSDLTVKGSGTYTPLANPTIFRTQATANYDAASVTPNSNIKLSVIISDKQNRVPTDVKIYLAPLSKTGAITPFEPGQLMTLNPTSPGANQKQYDYTVPLRLVQDPGFKYYVVATYASDYLKTPAVEEEQLAWTVAVAPNVPPVISVSSQSAGPAFPCSNFNLQFNVFDNTTSIKTITLLHRPINTGSDYTPVDFTATSTNQNFTHTFTAADFSDKGLEYYIIATDNYDALGHTGTYIEPVKILISTAPRANDATKRMTINLTNIQYACRNLRAGDEIRVSYPGSCSGKYEVAGVLKLTTDMVNNQVYPLYVYGNTLSSGKNGPVNGDQLKFEIIRNGYTFELTPATAITYLNGGVSSITSRSVANVPIAEISYRNVAQNTTYILSNNDITPNTVDGTDFGYNVETRTFTIKNVGCGTSALDLTSAFTLLNGNTDVTATATEFQVAYKTPKRNSLTQNQTQDFTISYTGAKDGTYDLRVTTNADAQTNPFTFRIKGNKYTATPINLAVSPNPTANWGANASFTLPNTATMTSVKVYDSMGNLRLSVYDGYLQGYQNLYLNTPTLPKGQTYTVRVTTTTGIVESVNFVVPQ